MGRLIALILALVAAGLIAWRVALPPEPKPASTPATEFSAERAKADVSLIAKTPHPMASPENARVRDALVARMAALGLSPQVRPGVGVFVEGPAIAAGRTENIVGVLPGRDGSLPAVAVMAHYDSVPGSPGAADDAAGVASALEIVRAIAARGPPARDVMVVITDGEEVALLGADAFFRQDPMAKRVGLVVNMETRGSSGRAYLFQTSPGNGPLIDMVRKTAVRPWSSSLMVLVYDALPNDTDLTISLRAKVPGVNFAFADSQSDYHSPTATPENLDRGSLQDMGTQALAATAAAAFAPALPPRGADAVYSQTFGDLLIAYPAWVGWALVLATAVLIAIAGRTARRLEPFPWTDSLRGAGAAAFAVTGAAAFLIFARRATGVGFGGLLDVAPLLAQAQRWELAVGLIALGVLLLAAAETARGRRNSAVLPVLAGLGSCAFGGLDPVGLGAGLLAGVLGALSFGRPVSRSGAWLGVLLLVLLTAVAVQAAAPAAAFVVAWPLLAAALAAALTALGARRGYGELAILALFAVIALGWLGGFAHAVFVMIDLMPLAAAMLLLAAPAIWPLAQPADGAPPGRWIGAILLLAGLLVTAWVRFETPWTARHPEPSKVVYHLDADARTGRLVRYSPAASAWSDEALTGYGRIAPVTHWVWGDTRKATAPAPYVEAPMPTPHWFATPVPTLDLALPSGARTVNARLRPAQAVTLLRVNGVDVNKALTAGQWTSLLWQAPGEPLRLEFSAAVPMELRAASTIWAWPAGAQPLPPRPASAMPWDTSDTTLVTKSFRSAW